MKPRVAFICVHNFCRSQITEALYAETIPKLKDVIDDLYNNNKKVIFTMGKGGVGKTTIAA
ncbi:MAG: hypothetical protein ACREV6_21750 [Clostridium sp.]|uniref:arsenate reductase/protein-tyrosine-phosphatase family protein n=1 Tax=Clostridium sp. TaxID=1506 RepID=UPI003D6D5FA1